MNTLVLMTLLAIPGSLSVSDADADANFEFQRSELEQSMLSAQQELAADHVSEMRQLFQQKHVSLVEYVSALGRYDDATTQLNAAKTYRAAVKAVKDKLQQQSPVSQLTLIIPGFDAHPDLHKVATHRVVAFDDLWMTLLDEQTFVRTPNTFLSSTAWRNRHQKLENLPPEFLRESELAELQHQFRIADSSERLQELSFRPLRILNSDVSDQFAFLQSQRRDQVATAGKHRSQRVMQSLRGRSNQLAMLPVSFTQPVSPKLGSRLASKDRSPTNTELDNAVTTARVRIDGAIKNLSHRKSAWRLTCRVTVGKTPGPNCQASKLAAQAMVVAEHELEIRRAEHLYLVGRRGELFSKDPDAYQNWQQPLKQIFELRSESPLAKLADIKVAINKSAYRSMKSLFDQGLASTKETTDAEVKLGRSVWQRDMLRHKSNIYGRIADLL